MTITRRHHQPLLVLFSGMGVLILCMGIGRFAYTPMVPVMHDAVGLSLTHAGYIASVNYLGYLVGALLPFATTHLLTHYRMIVLSVLGTVISTAGMAYTEHVITWSIWRFISGVVSAFGIIGTTQVVLNVLAQHQRSSLSGFFYAGVGIGIVISTLLVNAADMLGLNWQSLWLELAIIALFTGLPALRILTHKLPAAQPSSERKVSQPLIWLAIGYGCSGFGYVITATFLPVLLDTQGADITSWLWVGLSAIPSTLLWGYIGRKIGKPLALVLTMLLQSLSVLLPIFMPNTLGLMLSAILLGSTFMPVVMLSLDLGHHISGANARFAITLLTTAYATGQILAPGLAGRLADYFGNFNVPLLVAASALFLGAWAYWRLHQQLKLSVTDSVKEITEH